MILIGQYDSPFVRRVGVAMRLYSLTFEHRPWSVFADGERLVAYNPLRRVPTLVLDDGEVLIETAAILDHLDESVGTGRALVAKSGSARRMALKLCALAGGVSDKAVSMFYEKALHATSSDIWVDRCTTQIGSALDALEADRRARSTPWWLGQSLSHVDIAVACALRFIDEAHPGVLDVARWPGLVAHGDRCESLEVFQEISQPFIAPA